MSGRVELVGQPLSELDRRALAQRLSWVPQHEEAAAGFTAREVVAMGRAPYQGAWLRSRAQDEEVVEETLQACGLRDLANRLLTSLSGGEQKRVHIARALAQRAPVLLLDEASAHLDIRHAVELHGLLRAQVLARQIACLAVMHDLNAAARFADRIVLLDAGRIVAEGSVEAVMTEARLGAVFGTAIHVATAGPDGRPTFLAVGPQATD
jgi:iron complex transport system ATP-binding protein